MATAAHSLLRQTISTIECHDHICMIYDTPEQEVAAAALSVEEGLRRGEKCFYVIGENSGAKDIWERVLDGNPKFQEALKSGQLTVVTSGGNYIQNGQFNPDEMLQVWADLLRQAKSDGYPSMRILGDPAWAIGNPTLERQLIEYEAKVNTFFENNDASAVCLYNRNRYNPGVIRDVLRTHPMVIYGDHICRNHFYVPPEQLLAEETPSEEVDRLLESITKREQLHTAVVRTEKLAAVGRMAATIAHEINNPVEAVMNLVYLAARASDNENVRRYLEQADAELRRVSGLTKKTLAFYRDSSAPAKVQLSEVVSDILPLLEHRAMANGVTVTSRDSDVAIVGREGEVRQILLNLMSNALDAAKPGGRIEIRMRQTGATARILVFDDGGGISELQRTRLFEPFFTTKAQGNGLGLWITKELIQSMGGTIRVRTRTEAPTGTVFLVYLPLRLSGRAID